MKHQDGFGLGAWDSEIPEGAGMTRFVCNAQKSYTDRIEYGTKTYKDSVRLKGVQLTIGNQEIVTMENMDELVSNSLAGKNPDPITTTFNTIDKHYAFTPMKTKDGTKNIRVVIDKTVLIDPITGAVIPYGYNPKIKIIDDYILHPADSCYNPVDLQ